MSRYSAQRPFLPVLLCLAMGSLSLAPQVLWAQGGPPRRPAVSVTVQTIEATHFASTVVANGALRARNEIAVRPETSGRIVELDLENGARVEEGHLIARLDDRELRAQLEVVDAALALAERTAVRQRDLFSRGATSEDALDNATSRLSQLQAERRVLEERLVNTRIVAPFAGRLGLREVSLGAYVSPNDILTTLSTSDALEVDFSLPERYQGQVEVGTEISLEVRGFTRPFTGTIQALAPQIDANTRTLQFRAAVPNPDEQLLPGNFARITIPLDAYPDALMVPASAIFLDDAVAYTFIVEEGVARRREISLGVRTRTEIQVLSGIRPGEQIVVRGGQALREGAPVAILAQNNRERQES